MANANSISNSNHDLPAEVLECMPAPSLERETATKLNPFIGFNLAETLERCDDAISDLGYVISGSDQCGVDFDKRNLYRMFEAITIAMRYELKRINQGEQETQVA